MVSYEFGERTLSLFKRDKETALSDLKWLIDQHTVEAKAIIDLLPTSYSHKSMRKEFDAGWEIGFGRALAEVKRLVERQGENI